MTAGIGDYVADKKHAANWPALPESTRIVYRFRIAHFTLYSRWPDWAGCKTIATLVNQHGGQIQVSTKELDAAYFVCKTREEVVAERLLA